MPRNETVVDLSGVREANYRLCRFCGNKVHHLYEINRKGEFTSEIVERNVGCGNKSNCGQA